MCNVTIPEKLSNLSEHGKTGASEIYIFIGTLNVEVA